MGLAAVNDTNMGKTGALIQKTQPEADCPVQFTEGEVIEGTVTGIEDDRVSVKFEEGGREAEFKFSRDSIKGAYKGEKRSFKVMQVTSGSVVLKDLGGVCSESGKMVFTSVGAEQLSLVEGFRDVMGDGDAEKDEALKSAYARMSEKDCESFWEEGFSIEKYNSERLVRALERIKLSDMLKQTFRESSAESLRRQEEDIESISEKAIAKNARQRLIAKQLKRADLPVTKENLSAVENAMTLAAGINAPSDGAKAYLIKNEELPSIKNLYTSMHMGSPRVAKLDDEIWELLRPQAEDVLQQANVKLEPYGLSAQEEDARWLTERGLDLTEGNVVFKKQLDTLEAAPDEVLYRAVEQLKNGGEPQDALLAVESGERQDSVQGYAAQASDVISRLGLDGNAISAVTARRRLEEIRLDMSLEANHGIAARDFGVRVEEIENTIEALKRLEQEYYRSCCSEVGAEAPPERLDVLADIGERFDILRNSPAYVLGSTYDRRSVITVRELSDEGRQLSVRLQEARETYEAVGTGVRRDLGDSISAAFRNIDGLLQENGFEVSEANRRAIRILAYNSMDISRENLEGVKNYDDKVNRLLDNMKPAVAAELVKRGVDPLSLPVDDLNDMLGRIYDEQGYDGNEKYSEFLVRLDRMGALDSAERSAYIGIYRLLNRLQKDGGAVIGSVYGSGAELTLGNLLTADRTRRRGHMDVNVDESFGGLTDVVERGMSISSQILGCITPEKLRALDGGEHSLGRMSLDRVLEGLRTAEGPEEAEDVMAEQRLQRLREAALSGNDEAAFLRQCGQPDSITNIMAMKELMQSPDIYERIRKLAGGRKQEPAGRPVHDGGVTESTDVITGAEAPETDITASITDRDTLSDAYDKLLDEQEAVIDASMDADEITSADSLQLCRLGGHISLLRALARREFYELPVRTADGSVAQINLTVVHDSAKSGQIHIRMREDNKFSLELECRNGAVGGLVSCSDSDTVERVKEALAGVQEQLVQSGYSLGMVHYASGGGSELSYMKRTSAALAAEDEDAASTNDLYRIARIFVERVAAGV